MECLEDGATGSAQLHGKINRRKSSQSPLLEQEPALLFQRVILFVTFLSVVNHLVNAGSFKADKNGSFTWLSIYSGFAQA